MGLQPLTNTKVRWDDASCNILSPPITDAMEKYAKWHQKFGVPATIKRIERNTADLYNINNINSRQDSSGPIFVPHR